MPLSNPGAGSWEIKEVSASRPAQSLGISFAPRALLNWQEDEEEEEEDEEEQSLVRKRTGHTKVPATTTTTTRVSK